MRVRHQYIERASGRIYEEHPFADRLVRWMYHPVREHATCPVENYTHQGGEIPEPGAIADFVREVIA